MRTSGPGSTRAWRRSSGSPNGRPDFGPAAFVPEWGATVAGARDFLIAYNVNVLGTKEQAHRIALNLREQGRSPQEPGRLKKVKGIGWWVEEYGLAQVSMNLDDYRVTPPHVAYEACVEEARALKVGVVGSELVGLIPKAALLLAAEHYIARENLFVLDERQKIRLAVERLGLSSTAPFVPEKRVIEYMIPGEGEEALARPSRPRVRAGGRLAVAGSRGRLGRPPSSPPWAPRSGPWWAGSPTASGSSTTRTP